jgi:hypothetical protein
MKEENEGFQNRWQCDFQKLLISRLTVFPNDHSDCFIVVFILSLNPCVFIANRFRMKRILMKETNSEIFSSEKQTPIKNGTPDYSIDGVDLTLIRWMLSITPTERLQVLQQNVQSLSRLINESTFS